HIGPLTGVPQPTCPTDATTGMIECHWTAAYDLTAQTSWTSGIYLALLTNAQNYRNYIVFVVRDDSRAAPLLYQQPVTTYQAYNNYPLDGATGKSLYAFNSSGATTVSGGANAVKVSFDRPYVGDGTGVGSGQSFFTWEISFVRWMEKSGYDVTYSTDVDPHTNGGRLLNYRGLLSVGHDEYWSKAMYDAIVVARDAGVNLAFFGGDAVGWQARFEASSSGVPNRVLVCYRNATLDPITDPSLKTVQWRDLPLNRPEQTLIGVPYTGMVPWNNGAWVPYVVTNSGNWVYAGTGFRDGDSVPGIVGYEADRSFIQYPQPNAVIGTYTLLSNSPIGTSDHANASVYQAPSGAWVFGTGTANWNYALDNISGSNLVDPRIQQTTANILNRFVGVTYDNAVSSGFQWGVNTATTPPFIMRSGPKRAGRMMVSLSANNAAGIAASLGGVSGTLIPGTDSGATATMRTLIFQVINPPSGPQTATVSWTNSMNANVAVITVSGADQTTPCTNGTFAAFNTSPDMATSVTITSNAGGLTASLGYSANQWVSPFTNQTLTWGLNSSAVGGDRGLGAGTTTHTWRDQFFNITHSVSGANFKAAAF